MSATAILSSTDGQLDSMGQKAGADVVIAGVSDAKFSASNEFNDNMYHLSALVSLRAIDTHNGKVLTSFEMVGKSAGVSEDLARVKAVGQATPEVADKLLEDLVRSWKQERTHGQRYHSVVSKVHNYAKVVRPFMRALQKLTDVTQVNELGFKGTT